MFETESSSFDSLRMIRTWNWDVGILAKGSEYSQFGGPKSNFILPSSLFITISRHRKWQMGLLRAIRCLEDDKMRKE